MKLVKFAIFTIIVMLMELGISYLIANKFNLQLLDGIFSVGFVFILVSIFFSSTGGLFTNYIEAKTVKILSGLSNYKFKRTIGSLSVNCFNVGSILFFLIGLVVAFAT